ncbi:MAG: prolipoprotein diacylglyceryl transferase [Actinomycetota bacterium]|nr:prolipoprotein diacylglyceryl transferase [Actinomycetota bacterium]
MHPLASIPSPTQSVWHLGPLPIRAYALCIVAGIFVALALTLRRWRERGGVDEDVWDVAGWAIVFGILGGRLYHVITDPELYFAKGQHPINALKIWDGGLGIWGAIALGAVGAWIGCRRKGLKLIVFADAAVPGVIAAQGIGRWGNWFNNELYGGPTSLPWRLQVHDISTASGHSQPCSFGHLGASVCGYYQPTFLYESVWDLALAALLLYLDRRLRLGRGNVTALYVMGYTLGRGWIEALRHDHANHILGLRLNDWTALVVFLLGLAWFVTHGGFQAEREGTPYARARPAAPGAQAPDGEDAYPAPDQDARAVQGTAQSGEETQVNVRSDE